MSDIWCVNGKTWYSKDVVDKVIEKCRTTLNMVYDYKTYFRRDNKSLKQEGFKALYEILELLAVESEE